VIVTIVVPTYNRGPRLAAALERLLASDTTGLDEVEVIVVDDGSTAPAAPVVASRTARPGFSLCCYRQANAGPAAARNHGFRRARGDVVLFVDDDILCPPGLVRQHVEAHRRFPGTVIFGRYPFVQASGSTPLIRYLDSLGHDSGRGQGEDFLDAPIIASGHISFERAMFNDADGIYRDDLAVPAAEEYELSARLRDRQVRALLATRITALHDRPVEIRGMCRQAYKYGKGCAEAALKSPLAAELPELQRIIEANRPIQRGEPARSVCKKLFKACLSPRPLRTFACGAVGMAEHVLNWDKLLAPLYRGVIGLFFFAGVRAGLREYALATTLESRANVVGRSTETRC
jgi:hypothetical protein